MTKSETRELNKLNALAKIADAGYLAMARRIAIDMARELNGDPKEAQNWRALEDHDELPEFDYLTLKLEFGKITPAMEAAYKAAFNDTFVEWVPA